MSTTPNTKPQTIKLGDRIQLKTRITVANLRRLKQEGGIDFTSQETGPMLTFAIDPEFVVIACYQLYKNQFDAAKMDENQLAELCGSEEIELLRQEVTQQMQSFSQFWRILSTQMENLQSGDTNLLELGAQIQAQKEASGLSS